MSEKKIKPSAKTLRIQMMNSFCAYADERPIVELVERSRKGAALIQYLILQGGETVSRQRLIEVFWEEEDSSNPENALKTLVSRLRKLLADCAGPAFSECIGSERGGYRWVNVPGVSVDLFELESALTRLEGDIPDEERQRLTLRALELYTGDLLEQSPRGQQQWSVARAASLRGRIIEAVRCYADLLARKEDYLGVVEVCRRALDIDSFDDGLHIKLMNGLVRSGRTNEALVQYKHVMHLYYRYLGMPLSDELKEFYDYIAKANRSVEFSLEAITEQLAEGDSGHGAFVCEYAVFKEVFNLQMRSLQRMGTPVFLAVIMVEGSEDRVLDSIEQDALMSSLLEVLQENLRRGDTITRFSPTVFALLLPTVNYKTGNMVMERMKSLFYRRHPNSNITYKYLIGPLTERMASKEPKDDGK